MERLGETTMHYSGPRLPPSNKLKSGTLSFTHFSSFNSPTNPLDPLSVKPRKHDQTLGIAGFYGVIDQERE